MASVLRSFPAQVNHKLLCVLTFRIASAVRTAHPRCPQRRGTHIPRPSMSQQTSPPPTPHFPLNRKMNVENFLIAFAEETRKSLYSHLDMQLTSDEPTRQII